VTSLEGTGPYSVQLLLNAAGEEESYTGASNDTWETAQDLSSSVVVLPDGGDRLAVVGQTGVGTIVDLTDIGFDGAALSQPVKGLTEFEPGKFLLSDGNFLYELTTGGEVTQLGGLSVWTTVWLLWATICTRLPAIRPPCVRWILRLAGMCLSSSPSRSRCLD
jgi:hypothetical protein